jgi:hypothetical protein
MMILADMHINLHFYSADGCSHHYQSTAWRSYRLVCWLRSAEVGLSERWLPLSEDNDDMLLVRDTWSVAPPLCLGPSSASPRNRARFSSTSESRGGLCFPSLMRLFTLLRVELLQQTHCTSEYIF